MGYKSIKMQCGPQGMNNQGNNCCVTTWCSQGQCYNQARIGKPAPQFTMETVEQYEIKQVSFKDYIGKYVVLVFYPKDFTFICPTELLAFNDAKAKFDELNAQVLCISCDTVDCHWNWCEVPRKKGGLGKDFALPLCADQTKCCASMYGCLFTDGPDAGVASRATFIIDTKGVLRHATYSDLGAGRNEEETLRLLTAFQYSDENGVGCPSKWKKGDKVIKPNQKDKFEYFEQA